MRMPETRAAANISALMMPGCHALEANTMFAESGLHPPRDSPERPASRPSTALPSRATWRRIRSGAGSRMVRQSTTLLAPRRTRPRRAAARIIEYARADSMHDRNDDDNSEYQDDERKQAYTQQSR